MNGREFNFLIAEKFDYFKSPWKTYYNLSCNHLIPIQFWKIIGCFESLQVFFL